MRKKIIFAFFVAMMLPLAASQPVNQTTDVKPGLTPDSPFYFVESFVEGIEIKVAEAVGGPEMKSKAIANNAEERLAEAEALAEKNKTDKVGNLVERYSEGMNQSRELASKSNDSQLKGKLDNATSKNVKKLEEVKKKVPEQAQKGIQNAIDKSKREKPLNRGKTQKPENPDENMNENTGKPEDIGKNNTPDKNKEDEKSGLKKPDREIRDDSEDRGENPGIRNTSQETIERENRSGNTGVTEEKKSSNDSKNTGGVPAKSENSKFSGLQ